MGDYSRSQGRTAANDILDYAVGTSLLAVIAITTGLISLGTPVLPTIATMAIIGGIWSFTIVPHLVAYWVNIPVDNLLGITDPEVRP